MDTILREKVEVLDGSRRRGEVAYRAAVRITDLGALLQVPARPTSARAAGDPVTPAEFNALVDEVHRLHAILLALQEALQRRVL